MPILIRNIPLSLHEPVEVLRAKAARRLRVPADAVRLWSPVRRSLDARPGRGDEPIRWVYNIELALDGGLAAERRRVGRLGRGDVAMLEPKRLPVLEPGRVPLTRGPVVVGFGPAGMFAGLLLAEMGYRPVVLERGRDVARRDRDVERFWAGGGFEPNSNLLFGEGGAGCYSDGKLYARGHDPRRAKVLETFYRFGADPDILIDGRPHVGSDRLPGICRRLREAIASAGGEVRFEQRVTGFEVADGRLAALRLAGVERMPVGPVILGVGHSARDTLTALASAGVELAAKGFQMGLRIEHPQAVVNAW